jgi:hypothetical protein
MEMNWMNVPGEKLLEPIVSFVSIDFLLRCTTVKPAHAVTSIKQSPELNGHLFLVLCDRKFHMN